MKACEVRTVDQKLFDFDGSKAIIPWAEGNGLWMQMTELVSSLSGVDVITLFARNPHTCDSAEKVAVRIGRRPDKVKSILEALQSAGFLNVVELEGMLIYRLADDPHRRQTLQQYVIWLQEGYHWTRMGMEQ
jgi:hypothetical protein